MKQGKNAQVALEYLITYGWALIAIATIIGVLIFATSGGINTTNCTTFLTLICKGIGVDGDTLILVLQNATGQTITINPFTGICFGGKCGYATIVYNGTRYRFDSVDIPAGAEFRVEIQGLTSASEMNITYTEKETGLEQTVESDFKTELEGNIITSCDTPINQPGIYVLKSDITANGANCLEIESGNVVIDCKGHRITNTGATYVGIYGNSGVKKNVTILNCEIRGFQDAIQFIQVEDAIIGNNIFNENITGINLQGSPRNIISNNEINENSMGIFVSGSNNVQINNNTICFNAGQGSAIAIRCQQSGTTSGSGNNTNKATNTCQNITGTTNTCP